MSRKPKAYYCGHKCNDWEVASEVQKSVANKIHQLCRCKCGVKQWFPIYRLNAVNKQAITACAECRSESKLSELPEKIVSTEYGDRGRTIKAIAADLGIHSCTLAKKMTKLGIPRRISKVHNLKGKFRSWTVLKKTTNRAYLCECDCGNQQVIDGWNLLKHKSKQCRKCCGEQNRGKNSVHWKGHGNINGYVWGKVKREAANRNLPFKITIKYAWDLFKKQQGRCALTGWPLRFKAHHQDQPATASLDRIDSKRGYVKGNVQWVHKDVNLMKVDFAQKRFLEVCAAVAKLQKS